MRVKQRFDRKQVQTDLNNVSIVAVETLSHKEYQQFSESMLDDYWFILAHAPNLYVDGGKSVNALLLLDEEGEDGILVNSEGTNYARYSAAFPYAKRYVKQRIHEVARAIIESRFCENEFGEWVIGFEDIKEHFDMTITSTNGIGTMLLEELQEQEEIAEIVVTEDALEITEYLEQVPESVSSGERFMTVLSLIGCNFEDVHLVDRDEEHDLATISELGPNTLTEEGKKEWKDVLSARVERVYEGDYGLQVEVSGCPVRRLREFSYMLAGYCAVSDYNRWVSSGASEQTVSDNDSFAQKCYEHYRQSWCAERGIELLEVNEEFGINGECYVSFEEFLGNEYKNVDCMRSILGHADFERWQSRTGISAAYEVLSKRDIEEMLERHLLWLNDVPEGQRADFRGYMLSNVDLSGRKLNSVNFNGARIQNVNFSSADICFADFSGADVHDCNFSYTSVDEANFRHVGFENCDLSYLLACHCNFAGAEFDRCNLFNSKLNNCCLEHVNTDSIAFADCNINGDQSTTEYEWYEEQREIEKGIGTQGM